MRLDERHLYRIFKLGAREEIRSKLEFWEQQTVIHGGDAMMRLDNALAYLRTEPHVAVMLAPQHTHQEYGQMHALRAWTPRRQKAFQAGSQH